MEENNNLPDGLPDIDTENQIEEIIDFYKNKALEDEDTPAESAADDETKSDITDLTADDEEMHDITYGLSNRNKYIITYAITAAICLAILFGSYGIALILPYDNEQSKIYADELRGGNDYIKIKTEYAELTAKTEKMRETVDDKKTQAEGAEDYDNTKAELREQISEKTGELKVLNESVSEKTAKIAAIDAEIAAKAGSAISLSPGRYTVGTDIAAGKYSIVGNGSFSAATSGGASKYNTKLGSTPVEVELSTGDRLRLDCTVKFTPSG